MKKALATLVVLAVASAASADLICEIVTNTSPGTGLASYTIWFKGETSGDALAAFVGSITGPLHQGWYWVSPPGFWYKTPYNNTGTDNAKDTRLMFTEDDNTTVSGWKPTEDNASPVLDTDGVYYGWGTYLAGAADTNMVIALTPTHQTTNLAFAQVVIPAGSQFTLKGEAGAANEKRKVILDITVPEPATLGLVMLGAAAVLARRRRR